MFLEWLRQEYRNHRMSRFAVWVAAYGVAIWMVARTTGSAPGILSVIFWVACAPPAFSFLIRIYRLFKDRLLWRLRRRLVVAYLFIAVVPVALILTLVALGGYIINGQFAAFLVISNLRARVDALQDLDRMMANQADTLAGKAPQALLDDIQKAFAADIRGREGTFPGLSLTVRFGSDARTLGVAPQPQPIPVSVPAWLKENEFAGIIVDSGQLALRAVERKKTSSRELVVILSQPISSELLDQVGQGLGPIGLLAPRPLRPEERPKPTRPGINISQANPNAPGVVVTTDQGEQAEEVQIQSQHVPVPDPVYRFDYLVYNAAMLDPVLWGGDQLTHQPQSGFFMVTSRFVTLDRKLLSTLGQSSAVYWVAFAAIGIVFLLIELVAMIVGTLLTRSITKTVDKLHEGTERVKVGDFSYRIGLPARDQLSALGAAFDGMTASVERLLRESLEKTRLEGELEIARQVQSQLFPQGAPEVAGLQLFGACHPARVVSGDYYDFLRMSPQRFAIVVGDISGKGISAALLMAAIQSALHSQFYDGRGREGIEDELSSSSVVARLNRQLFASSPREKYATFFYAVYDSLTRRLIYTNAGHPPPFYIHRGKIERLGEGGTVVGLFDSATYEQAVVLLEAGDMIVAYTDGITEPENSYGEEFGEARLLEAVQRAAHCSPNDLVEEIYRAVNDWTGSPELQDDMTLVVARAV